MNHEQRMNQFRISHNTISPWPVARFEHYRSLPRS